MAEFGAEGLAFSFNDFKVRLYKTISTPQCVTLGVDIVLYEFRYLSYNYIKTSRNLFNGPALLGDPGTASL